MDIEGCRSSFPALGRGQVYMDNAGGSQALGTVIDSINDYLCQSNVQIGGSYAVSRESTSRYRAGFDAAAHFVNCSTDQIVFGWSTTQLLRNLSYTLKFNPGDEIVVSAVDHESNISPWLAMAERQGLTVKWWRPEGGKGSLHVDMKKLLSEKTRLVAITHASNVLGIANDVKTVCREAHAVGALVCVDGVAYAPHHQVDVKHLDVDFYTLSWYKIFGPHVSMLYASWRAMPVMKSLGHFFHGTDTLEGMLGLAGGSHELVQSIPLIASYLSSDRRQFVEEQEAALTRKLVGYLEQQPTVSVYGKSLDELDEATEHRLATVSFKVHGWSPRALVEKLEEGTNFGLKWGHFYCPRLVRDILGCGPEGLVRVSLLHYNTSRSIICLSTDVLLAARHGADMSLKVEEVDAFIAAIDHVILGNEGR